MQDKSRCGWRRGGISNCVDENETKCKRCPGGKLYNHTHEGGGEELMKFKVCVGGDRVTDERARETFESDQWDAIDVS